MWMQQKNTFFLFVLASQLLFKKVKEQGNRHTK